MEYFAKNIKFLRTINNITQAEIKDMLGIEATTWSGYERGKSFPNLKLFHSICEYFQVSETDLLNSDLSKGKVISKADEKKSGKKVEVIGQGMGKLMPENHLQSIIDAQRISIESLKQTVSAQQILIDSLKARNYELSSQNEALKTSINNEEKKKQKRAG